MTTSYQLPAIGFLALLLSAAPLPAQTRTPYRVPAPNGFRVFVLADMEGMGSVVHNREIIAGNEGERYRTASGPDYWERYRGLFTQEVNAVLAGARRGGARSFVVNEAHGGNRFASLIPEELDTAALLVRGYPKPMVMSTGLDSSAGVVLMVAMHSSPAAGGVIAHNYAFDQFTVNGRPLNETGINALVAGEYGVPVGMVTGDDIVVREAKEQLGDQVVGVVVKYALGRSAAITIHPAIVRRMVAESSAVAVRRAQRGELRPFTLPKPYTVEFTLRSSYPQEYVTGVAGIQGFRLERTGDRSWRMVTNDAREMALMIDEVERVVLP
jgi:D-amino peptidase